MADVNVLETELRGTTLVTPDASMLDFSYAPAYRTEPVDFYHEEDEDDWTDEDDDDYSYDDYGGKIMVSCQM